MSKEIKLIASLGIILGVWTFASGKICPEMKVITNSILKFDILTKRLVTETKFKEQTAFVCCKGYREIGRIFGGLQPKCDPICEPVCGNGTCYAPNRCSCELGYTHSADGSCVVDTVTNSVDSAKKIYSKDVGQSNEATGRPFASYTIEAPTTKQPNTTTVRFAQARDRFVPTFTTKQPITTTVRFAQPRDRFVPTFTTKQPNTTTVRFAQRRDRFVPTFTTKQPNTTTVRFAQARDRFVPTFTRKQQITTTVRFAQPRDRFVPTFTTKQPSTPTVNFEQPTDSSIPATTRRTGSEKCARCDRGTCVNGICLCALGYRPKREGGCHPVCSQSCLNGRCVEPNRCACIEGYSYDWESLQCKPLCNGQIYGCIRGTCVGFNQCRCDNGTVLQKDELFHCIDRDWVQLIGPSPWFLLLLVVPVVAVGASFCVVISRWKTAKVNRVQGQEESFSEVRFHNAGNEHSSTEGYQKACSKEKYLMDDPIGSQGAIRRNGNILIINT